jgi:hypothetical protein
LGRLSRVARALISVAISVVSLLFLYGYLKPLGLSPDIFGPGFSDLFTGASSTGAATGFGSFGLLVPGGLTGLIAYTVLSKIGRITSAATAPSMPSPDEMMRRMNIPGMMNMPGMMGGAGGQSSMPATLPADISRSQFIVLRSYRQGYKNSKEIGKALSMDKNEVDKETSALKSNGYLSKENRLTSKAIEILGS